jgi:hypothetical protein
MVIVFEAHTAVTPAGNPVAVPIPVAPVVVCVIFVNKVFIHKVSTEDAAPTVLAGVTVIALLVADATQLLLSVTVTE